MLNTRSVKSVNANHNKLADLRSIVSLSKSSIICLTETWLSPDVSDLEILSNDFNVYRNDRSSTGGGVLIAVHSNIASKPRYDLVTNHHGSLEVVVVELNIPKLPKLALINVYNPPAPVAIENSNFLRNILQAVTNEGTNHILLMGDFNLPNLDITTGLPLNSGGVCTQFYEVFNDFDLVHCIKEPTHRLGNRLDLILSSPEDLITSTFVEEGSFPSDHFLINFSRKAKYDKRKINRTVFNFKKANWQGLKQALRDSNLSEIIRENNNNVSNACFTWTNTVLSLVNSFIPKINLKNADSPPWIDGEVIRLSKKKETSRKKAIRINTPTSWEKYRKLRNELRVLVNQKHKSYINDSYTGLSENPKRFWGMVSSKNKKRSLPTSLEHDNITESSSVGKANLFNNFFFSNFTPPLDDHVLPEIRYFTDPLLTNVDLSIAEVRLILSTLDQNKATGPDNLPGLILKECSAEIAPSLTLLLNLSLQSGTVPDMWKHANVIPVFKKGDKNQISNYRPVSLLSITSKVLERAILNKFQDRIFNHINKCQHGFTRGRSTETQLLSVLNDINVALDNGIQTDVIYLDFSKAFDSVSHQLLTHKLKLFGFSGILLNWFANYLHNRYQRVVIEGQSSNCLPAISGVPQGSILGPILFLLYSNDIGDDLSKDTKIALFADDAKIYRRITSPEDSISLQNDLATLEHWSQTWRLNFNAKKCKVMHFTRARLNKYHFSYNLNGTTLDSVSEFNDLGVVVTNTLCWKSHIRNIVSKANRILGLIKRTLGPSAPLKPNYFFIKP